MAIERSIKIDVDATKAKAELLSLAQALKGTDTAAEGAAKGADKAEKEYKQMGTAAEKSAKQSAALSSSLLHNKNAAEGTKNTFRAMRGASTQLGFQLQDIAVQAQMGTSAFVILGQQGSQIASIFGPGGAIVGALIAVGAAAASILAPALLDSSEKSDILKETLQSLGEVAVTTKSGVAVLTDEVAELAKVSKDAALARISVGLAEAQNVILGTAESITELSDDIAGIGSVDISDAIADLQALDRAGISTESSIARFSGTLSSVEGNTNELASALSALTKTYGINNSEATQLIRLLGEVEKTKSTESVKALAQFLSSLSQQTGFSNRELNKLSSGVNNAAIQMDNAENVTKILRDALDNLDGSLKNTESSTTAAANSLSNYGSQVVGLIQGIEQSELILKGLNREAFIQNELNKLGADATDDRREAVAKLAGQQFDLTQKIKDQTDAERDASKAAADAKRRADQARQQTENSIKANVNLVDSLQNQLNVAMLDSARDQAILTAEQRLNGEATAEQVQRTRELAAAIFDANEQNKKQVFTYAELKANLDPLSALNADYLEVVNDIKDAELDTTQQRELRTIAEGRYKDKLEELRKQTVLNRKTDETFFGALQQGLEDAAATSESSFDQIREVGRNAIDDLSGAISEFVSTGEFDFRSFAASAVAELLKIETKARLIQGLKLLTGDPEQEGDRGILGDVVGGAASGIGGFFGGGSDDSSEGGEEPLRLGSLFGSGEDSGFGQDSANSFGETWTDVLGNVGDQFTDVFGNALAQSDQLGSSTESAAASIGTSLIGSLVKLGAQALINATIGAASNAALVTAGTAAASALATAWAPAAAAASLATAGANSIPAGTGISTIYGLTQTLSQGVGAAGGAAGGGGATFARGGVPELSEFSSSVVSTPTRFAAGGSFNNQMGEAGPEAILPLQRTSSGELGVKANISGQQIQAAPQVNVPVQVINVAENPQDYLGSAPGVKQIINIMTQNRRVLQG